MDRETAVRELYGGFDARDIDTCLAGMVPDVDWPNAWEGGYVKGHDEVRAYWTRQWAEVDSRGAALALRAGGQRRRGARVPPRGRRGGRGAVCGGGAAHLYTPRRPRRAGVGGAGERARARRGLVGARPRGGAGGVPLRGGVVVAIVGQRGDRRTAITPLLGGDVVDSGQAAHHDDRGGGVVDHHHQQPAVGGRHVRRPPLAQQLAHYELVDGVVLAHEDRQRGDELRLAGRQRQLDDERAPSAGPVEGPGRPALRPAGRGGCERRRVVPSWRGVVLSSWGNDGSSSGGAAGGVLLLAAATPRSSSVVAVRTTSRWAV